ncbi:hypothetical protein ALC56_11167 [Trachymyrmex septentrionalis]|uniref:Uncharacterized protein n=1 Tax=Trachymyrmex septentrionalis TaxID=34720 RepID=A0A195F2J2_9HYME|nr:hypothetical protein ALC56_11167 [Trachymyrmex septentrionalis]
MCHKCLPMQSLSNLNVRAVACLELRRGTEKTKRGGRNREERDRTLGVFCAWPSRFCASATRAKEVAKQMAATLVFKTRKMTDPFFEDLPSTISIPVIQMTESRVNDKPR